MEDMCGEVRLSFLFRKVPDVSYISHVGGAGDGEVGAYDHNVEELVCYPRQPGGLPPLQSDEHKRHVCLISLGSHASVWHPFSSGIQYIVTQ